MRIRFIWLIGGFVIGQLVRTWAISWPEKPTGTTFTIVPIEAHAKVAVSLLREGDTLLFAPDGKRHYWSHGLTLPHINNITFNGGGTCWCLGEMGKESPCDVVITNETPGAMVTFK